MPSEAPKVFVPFPHRGIRPDLPQRDVPPDSAIAMRNLIWRNGRMTVAGAVSAAGTISADQERIIGWANYLHTDGTYRLVAATAKGWYKWSGGIFTAITGTALTGSAADQNVFRVFNTGLTPYLIGCNGANTLKKWNGSAATYSDVGGTPPRARAMMSLFDRVVLGNLKSGGTVNASAVDWSANKDPDTGWGTSPLVCGDTPGEIVSMMEAGFLEGYIYKTDAIYSLQAQGSNATFAAPSRKLWIAGPASTLSVVPIADGVHTYLARDGSVQVWDGTSLRSISRASHRHIAATMDFALLDRACGWYDSENEELWFFYAPNGASSNTAGVMINPNNGDVYPITASNDMRAGIKATVSQSISIGELTGAIGEISRTLGELDTLVRRTFTGTELGGLGVLATYWIDGPRSYGMSGWGFITAMRGDLDTFATVDEVEHFITLDSPYVTGITDRMGCEVLASENGEPVASVVPITTVGEVLDPVPGARLTTGHRKTGRYFALQVTGSTFKADWAGATIPIKPRGKR